MGNRGDISAPGSVDTSNSRASDELSEALENCSIRGRAKQNGARANRKKVPTQFKNVRGIFALLQGLLDAPVEIFLFEIFCYLDTGDLLQVSRTSKFFRSVLLDKSSEPIWRMARANVDGDLPPLPNDLNEIQYAHLIFDQYCHILSRFAINLGNVIMFCGGFALDAAEIAKKLFNSFHIYDWQALRIMLHPFRSFDILPKEKIKSASKDVYDVIFDYDVAVRLKAQFLALQSEEDRLAWLDRKREERQEIENHARQCEAWQKTKLDQRMLELYEIRSQRRQGILSRLGKIGWRQEAELILFGKSDPDTRDKLANHRHNPSITQVWANIEPDLLELLSHP
ncbi:hypothetical protein F5051DRAFT_444771 [Lentinula edodes]|nr:hypothetical protein F5051DRAFT_444771 [Lentinula edodes]